jgi:transposase
LRSSIRSRQDKLQLEQLIESHPALPPGGELESQDRVKLPLITAIMKSTSEPFLVYIGIDVSQKLLELHGISRRKQLPNTAAGHAKLIGLLPSGSHVILESSGGYEKPLWLALLRAGCRVSRVNPARVRDFARAHGRLAKTDPIDAALLCDYARSIKPKVDELPTEAQLQLEELVCRREQLVAMRAELQVQSQQLHRAELREQASSLLECFDAQIGCLSQQIQRLCELPEFASKSRRLAQVCGVGVVCTSTLLASMPELGRLSDAQAAALAGLAPYNDDSGPHRGYRHIRGGRVRVRRVLYMAALSAIRYNPILRSFYQRLLNKGKHFKIAITAVMRKLIILLNRLIREPHFVLES